VGYAAALGLGCGYLAHSMRATFIEIGAQLRECAKNGWPSRSEYRATERYVMSHTLRRTMDMPYILLASGAEAADGRKRPPSGVL
jgi:hypothetical protein